MVVPMVEAEEGYKKEKFYFSFIIGLYSYSCLLGCLILIILVILSSIYNLSSYLVINGISNSFLILFKYNFPLLLKPKILI